MGYTNFKNNESPALSNTTLNNMQIELMKLVFPIGSTYVTQTNTNPSTILRFGTWERLKGKVCLGLDEDDTNMNAIGKTGGEKTHTLTINEMPSHKHQVSNTTNSGSNGWAMSGNWADTGAFDTSATGGGQPHNNMQPYQVVGYMWIRKS